MNFEQFLDYFKKFMAEADLSAFFDLGHNIIENEEFPQFAVDVAGKGELYYDNNKVNYVVNVKNRGLPTNEAFDLVAKKFGVSDDNKAVWDAFVSDSFDNREFTEQVWGVVESIIKNAEDDLLGEIELDVFGNSGGYWGAPFYNIVSMYDIASPEIQNKVLRELYNNKYIATSVFENNRGEIAELDASDRDLLDEMIVLNLRDKIEDDINHDMEVFLELVDPAIDKLEIVADAINSNVDGADSEFWADLFANNAVKEVWENYLEEYNNKL